MQPNNPTPSSYTNPTPTPVLFAPDNPGQPYQPKKSSKRVYIILGVVLIFIVVGGLSLILFSSNNKKGQDNKSNLTNSTETKTTNSEEEQTKTKITLNNDSERKEIVAQIIAYATMYQANNNGDTPKDATALNNALTSKPGEYAYPLVDSQSNLPYTLVDSKPKQGEIQYMFGASCNDDGELVLGGRKRGIAARILLTDQSFYCNNN